MDLTEDLKAFMSCPPPALVRALRQRSRPRPRTAADEPTAHARWQLESLVQDVWEHTVGPESKVQQQILDSIAPIARTKVYDFGSGSGYYAMKLAQRGATVMCVERSRVKRMFLRFRIARHKLQKHVFLGRFTRTFDTALAINVLDHTRRPHGAIKALASRLAPEGKLVAWAAFPDDGWHTSGPAVRRRFRRSLLRHFEPQSTLACMSHDLMVLNRRRLKARTMWLDPELTIRPHPERRNCIVIFAPRAYADTLIASDEMRIVIALCREGNSVGRIRRLSERAGFDWNSTRRAIWKMCDAGLAVARPRQLLEVSI